MLRRRSIRTKLVYALVVLTVIFCVLSFSAIWGLKRYSRLAESVSQQAIEIPHANALNQYAESICSSYERLMSLRDSGGMIDASLLGPRVVDIENLSIVNDLAMLETRLQRYANEINDSSDQSRVLVSKDRQQRSLEEIRKAKAAIDDLQLTPRMMTSDGDKEFPRRLRKLRDCTRSHLVLIHSEMQEFSAEVRGQHTGLITFNWLCMGFAIFLVLVLWFSFQSLVAKPFRTLLDGSKLVTAGQYGHRIDLGTSDELSELANAMNSMSVRFRDVYDQQKSMNEDLDRQVKARTREVIQNEQLASVGFLAAGVAHEINNPLATIAWSSESLQTELDDLLLTGQTPTLSQELAQILQKNLRRIEEEAYRCKGITERLLDFSRLGDVSRAQVDVGQLVTDVVSMVGKVGEYKCKTLRVHCDENVIAHVNATEIRQVVLNLVTNALESVDCDGAVDVHVHHRGQNAYIGVYDDGCGMSQEVLHHLFEPFFTRRRDGTGTGLGLSITYRIVSQHHGSLTASSDGEGHGSRLEMLLPIQAVLDDTTQSNQSLNGFNHDARQAA